MPRFDGMGPMGQGPMTGRGLGPCGGGMGYSRGYGRGLGRGFGFRRFFSQKEEVEDLKSYQEDLKAELKAIEEELKGVK